MLLETKTWLLCNVNRPWFSSLLRNALEKLSGLPVFCATMTTKNPKVLKGNSYCNGALHF